MRIRRGRPVDVSLFYDDVGCTAPGVGGTVKLSAVVPGVGVFAPVDGQRPAAHAGAATTGGAFGGYSVRSSIAPDLSNHAIVFGHIPAWKRCPLSG